MTSLVLRSALIFFVGAAGAFTVNRVRPNGLDPRAFAPPAMCDAAESSGAPLLVEPAAAAALCGRTDVVIADARPASSYARGHIADAVHLPCDASGSVASDALAHVGSARTILVYGESTAEAQPVAASLRRRHHVDVRVIAGGFGAWEQAGLACASGPCDDCAVTGHTSQ